ncbi:MAG TPA: polysaccharide biosynthesis/export family protein [Pirellulales bacterium]|nr:polysaccharide biosynthesis/export family protein [Pirellulales bacterium]
MTRHPLAGPLVWALLLVDGADVARSEPGWNDARPIDWQRYAQGEYVGHGRSTHVDHYRLRPGDVLDFVLRVTRRETSGPYRLNPGDRLRIESVTDDEIDEELVVDPDGTIAPRLLGSIHVARRSVAQVREELERRYQAFYKLPAITVTPTVVNARLEDLRATADDRRGRGGQTRQAAVTPEGTVQLTAIGVVPAQGLSLDELKRELDERLAARVEGVELTPVLVSRAPRYAYVVGEVKKPGRYELAGPTTVMQVISLAGGWNRGGNLWSTVVFRRGDDWRLLATRLELRTPLYGHEPAPADEIWINDSDVVVVPKTSLLVGDNVINLAFTKGLYGVAHYRGFASMNFAKLSGTVPSISGVPLITPVIPTPAVPTPVMPGPVIAMPHP